MREQPFVAPAHQSRRASAVMLPIIDIQDCAHILLCKRPNYLKHHPGEICLPGGKNEKKDLSLRHTALRELYEELNIKPAQIRVAGKLPNYSTLTGFTITPFVGFLDSKTQWAADPSEVAASFLVPIHTLADASNWEPIPFQRFGQQRTLEGFRTPHGLLWGATASIIKNFTAQLAIPV
ncbi:MULTISPECIES: CoA pyrophosphatase [unclassified Pseudoalteromonas]|uniref:NUDIX hydrolase n=2 Tax=unclassified Pseudoalteromonas TaxID=194690 RepID=UPI000C0871BB|nr:MULTISPECIES: CoA pyrophosphatase [unclassified Pseudoalteromonas]MDP2636668.1 CoA pyrophosphatase [Pseudoalteromonas sp. 1_MG-2023]PHN89832.1 coenzyme A pyrophosphatase [Pseudoalteromonas sp. 3D05]